MIEKVVIEGIHLDNLLYMLARYLSILSIFKEELCEVRV